jgi:PAS domain S-box-containing protein
MKEEPRSSSSIDLATQAFHLLREVKDYAIYLLDPNGIVRTWNEGAHAIKGYTADEIIGQHFSTFFTPEDRADGRPARLLQAARADGRVEDQAWRLRKDGTRLWADVVITAIHDDYGEVQGFTKVTRDLTERRLAEELLRQSEERSRLLIEGVKDYAIFMLDPEGRVLSWNAGAQRTKGYSADEIIGAHFSVFYPPELNSVGHPARELEIARAVGRYEEEGVRVRKNGERFWASVVISAVYEPGTDKLRGFAKVTRDLTERRKAEEAMRSASEQIDLERLRAEEARSALQMRDEFISVAAHELRTPLAALMLKVQSAQSLVSQHAMNNESSVARLSERLAGAIAQVGRMSGLVQRLLDVSGIVAGRLALQLEPTSMSRLAHQVVEDFRDTAATRGSAITVTTQGAGEGRWDAARVEQVLINLISNAIKYGRGQPIDVRVEETANTVRFVVRDQGLGIRAEDAERIFERFERAASVDQYSGLGLGLYIAKTIVDSHGGLIRVASAPGQGSMFIVELPRAPRSQPADHSSSIREPS